MEILMNIQISVALFSSKVADIFVNAKEHKKLIYNGTSSHNWIELWNILKGLKNDKRCAFCYDMNAHLFFDFCLQKL